MKKGVAFHGTYADFSNVSAQDDSEFVRVAPYCDAPQVVDGNKRVIQRFDKESAEKLVEEFKANGRKLLSRLGFARNSIPFFNGHPDFAEAKDARDNAIYAEATDLEARDDGLFAKIKRSPMLERLKQAFNNALEISPRWLCEEVEDGIFKPFKLLSFGLVENGNLPNADLINSKLDEEKMSEDSEKEEELKAKEAEEETVNAVDEETAEKEENEPETVEEEKGADEKEEEKAEEETVNDASQNPLKDLALLAGIDGVETATPDELFSMLSGAITRLKEKAQIVDENERAKAESDALREEYANALVMDAFKAGKISPAEIDGFKAQFKDDFTGTKKKLADLRAKAQIKGSEMKEAVNNALSRDKEARANEADKATAREASARRLNDMINARLRDNPRGGFAQAMNDVLGTNEGRRLYSEARKF